MSRSRLVAEKLDERHELYYDYATDPVTKARVVKQCRFHALTMLEDSAS